MMNRKPHKITLFIQNNYFFRNKDKNIYVSTFFSIESYFSYFCVKKSLTAKCGKTNLSMSLTDFCQNWKNEMIE